MKNNNQSSNDQQNVQTESTFLIKQHYWHQDPSKSYQPEEKIENSTLNSDREQSSSTILMTLKNSDSSLEEAKHAKQPYDEKNDEPSKTLSSRQEILKEFFFGFVVAECDDREKSAKSYPLYHPTVIEKGKENNLAWLLMPATSEQAERKGLSLIKIEKTLVCAQEKDEMTPVLGDWLKNFLIKSNDPKKYDLTYHFYILKFSEHLAEQMKVKKITKPGEVKVSYSYNQTRVHEFIPTMVNNFVKMPHNYDDMFANITVPFPQASDAKNTDIASSSPRHQRKTMLRSFSSSVRGLSLLNRISEEKIPAPPQSAPTEPEADVSCWSYLCCRTS